MFCRLIIAQICKQPVSIDRRMDKEIILFSHLKKNKILPFQTRDLKGIKSIKISQTEKGKCSIESEKKGKQNSVSSVEHSIEAFQSHCEVWPSARGPRIDKDNSRFFSYQY